MKDFDFKGELERLPDKPGVYIMHSEDDTVIYVGKAKILKNRVRQYFRNQSAHTAKVRAMVSNVAYFEYIVTDSEIEALVLECNLIKKYRPKYNILLKDDKQYPYIKVTINEKYPKMFMTRTLKNDGAKYFGPYAGMSTVKNVIELATKIFRPPQCNRKFPDDIGKGRPCLNYHIKTCFAPCTGTVSEEEYRQVFYSICDFIGGKHEKLLDDLTVQMKEASLLMEYEKAADLRDKITAIKKLDEKQKIINSDNMTDMDIAAVVKNGDNAFCEIFFVRGGKVNGAENFRLSGVSDSEEGEILADFLVQFYRDSVFVPEEVLTECDISDGALIAEWLGTKRHKKVRLYSPKRGEKRKIAEMVKQNAQTASDNYTVAQLKANEKNTVLETLKDTIGMEKTPVLIEAYDISNISGSDNVGSMVVFRDGKPKRSRYRSFNIKSFEGADDYRAMQEVLYRRIKRAYDEQQAIEAGELATDKARFLPLPDMILIDGGATHLAVAKEVLEMMSLEDIPTFGMVKDDKHRTRALVSDKGEIAISPFGSVYKLIALIQDEVHRSAITHHRNRHNKTVTRSELDKITGVGEKRKKQLLQHFKSVDAIRKASVEELKNAGIDAKTAEGIFGYFNGE